MPMKKILILISLIMIFLLVGCASDFTLNNTITDTTDVGTTTSTTYLPTTTTIDVNMVISEVYQKIYEDLYNDVKAEVISHMSEERFEQIYAQVLEQILEDIKNGDIDVTAASIIDMILSIEEGPALAVVGVTTYSATGASLKTGSGVIYKHVGDKYFVVTNFHVVEDGATYEIVFEDGSTISAILKGVDDLVDLAVLSFVSNNEYKTASFGDSSQVKKGDIVIAVGNPKGYEFYGSFTMGIISGLDRYFDIDGDDTRDMFVNYIQHDAAINSGNSGGALFDIYGKVIGINVIKISSTEVEGMGFSIPSNLVAAICSDLEEFGISLQVPVLGISFMELHNNIDSLILNGAIIPEGVTEGFYIFDVGVSSTMYGYLYPDDILVSIDDIQLTTAEEFKFEFSKYKVGDVISISFIRSGNLITINDIELKAKVSD